MKSRSNRLITRVTALSLCVLLGAANIGAAAESSFTVGQKVEVSFLGKWVQGTIVSTDGNWPKVHFVDGNGRDHEQPVPPTRLRQVGGNPEVPAANRPAVVGPATAPAAGGPAAGPAGQAKAGVALTQADVSAMVDLTPAAGVAAPGQIPADPVVWPNAPVVKPITLKPRNHDEFFEKMGALLFADKVPLAVISYLNAAPGKDPSWRIERANLATGSSQVSAPVPGEVQALALSPDASRLLAISREGRVGMNDKAEIWTIDPKTSAAVPQILVSWKPYSAEKSLGREITWAGFVDSDRVLTASRDGKVVLWEVGAGKVRAVYSAQAASWSMPALSGGRKYLALPTENALFFLDPLSGKVLGKLEADSLTQAALSFRPDGKQVGAVMPGRFIVWDLAVGGAPLCDFSSTQSNKGTLAWASDGYVMFDNKYLVDLSRDVVLWSYRLGNGARELVGNSPGRFWYVAESSAKGRPGAAGSVSSVLVSGVLPEEGARKIAAGLKQEDTSLLKPGSKVALSVNVDAPDDVKQKITNALTGRLTANGMTLADDAPVKLEAATAPGESRDITYRVGLREEKVSVTGIIYRLAFTSDGQTAWARVTQSAPPLLVRIQAGETAQQAVDAARKPNWGFFLKAALPKIVPKPGQAMGFGESTLTEAGPQPVTAHSQKP